MMTFLSLIYFFVFNNNILTVGDQNPLNPVKILIRDTHILAYQPLNIKVGWFSKINFF